MIPRWTIFNTDKALQQAVLDIIVQAAAEAITQRGRFDIVLAGGTTPRAVYEELRKAQSDWARWHIWYGDERCLPVTDAERNSKMAYDAWLRYVPIPTRQIHTIPAELGAIDAAMNYSRQLAMLGEFDLVLLGMGEDGHTASLFPGHPWDNGDAAIAVGNAPKPPPDRVSLSAARLSRAKHVLFIVTGASKQQALNAWRRGTPLPAAAITSKGPLNVFMDLPASGQKRPR